VIRLMGVPAGAVVLTKVDLVDEELAALAAEEARELLATTPLPARPWSGSRPTPAPVSTSCGG